MNPFHRPVERNPPCFGPGLALGGKMKIPWFCILGLILSVSILRAQGDSLPGQKWVEQIDGSFAIPYFAATQRQNPGLGGDINIGYRFDNTLALFIGSGYYQYNLLTAPPAVSAQLSYIPVVGIVRLAFGEGPFRPYVFAGAGIAVNTYTQVNAPGNTTSKIAAAETNFYLAPGLGVLCFFSGDIGVFLQSRVDIDFTNPNDLGIPLANPSVFIPLQAGISLFTN